MTRSLPYFDGTVEDLRVTIADNAEASHTEFVRLSQTATPTAEEHHARMIAYRAALYGFATVSLLGFIGEKFGVDAQHQAAAMVDDMMVNGGVPYYEESETTT